MKFLKTIYVTATLYFINRAKAELWKPEPGTTWNDVIADPNFNIDIEKAEVVEVDFQTSAKKIELYHDYGKKVICYFSGGTIEKWRSDYDKYEAIPGLIKNEYGDWPGEYWLDFRVEGIHDLILARMREAKNNGCDALDVDNLDAYNSKEIKKWSNPITAAETVIFARWLSEEAHNLGLSIGLKNIAGLLPELSDYYDFAVNESCVNYVNECGLYRDFIKSGKAVFGLTYGNFEEKLPIMCKELNGIGISMSFKKTQKLVQDGFIFDGEKYCGSGYKNGYNHTIPVNVTTIKKTITQTLTTTMTTEKATQTSTTIKSSDKATQTSTTIKSSDKATQTSTTTESSDKDKQTSTAVTNPEHSTQLSETIENVKNDTQASANTEKDNYSSNNPIDYYVTSSATKSKKMFMISRVVNFRRRWNY
ncbi:hypothetical protein BCR36DRAFT_580409 [Piromyces finnis]|uniref:alpha-galactosidase n=1 Tax=Piromyces finnis TaxID=1754191 RepID=A0A1Y1VKD8_9FUNG|nr:hypothetical protein BCR36DRAFT_580409 [Piromyces finnis]|eukprot:ORX57837.1 hypothetical protein BCR36DRAFT_580409 [Piromyces finnis]